MASRLSKMEMDSPTHSVRTSVRPFALTDPRFPLALLNIIETFMNLAYMYLAHVFGGAPSPVVGFAVVSMTLSKTMLYSVQEYYCGFCYVGHNSMSDLIVYWIIPNGCVSLSVGVIIDADLFQSRFWIVVPSLIFVRLGKGIAAALGVAGRSATKTASGKQQ